MLTIFVRVKARLRYVSVISEFHDSVAPLIPRGLHLMKLLCESIMKNLANIKSYW